MSNLKFVDDIYKLFNFEYKLLFSSRPENSLGGDKLWDKAESQLKQALNDFGKPWEENPGDGAFYGPKIDVIMYDSNNKPNQCATIQVDFQAPIRFDMSYRDETDNLTATAQEINFKPSKLSEQHFRADKYDNQSFTWQEKPLRPGFSRPVVIHRAVMGSLERFLSILVEQHEGKWPFWLSPRQAIVLPISDKFNDYAKKVYEALKFNGFHTVLDDSNSRVQKKILSAQLEKWNYMLVVGKKEMESGTANLRERNGTVVGEIPINQIIEDFEKERQVLPKFKFDYSPSQNSTKA